MSEINGQVHAKLFDRFGRLIDFRVTENFIVEEGYIWMADHMAATPALPDLSYFAVGTGTGQGRSATGLANQIARKALTAGYPQIDASPYYNVLVFSVTFTSAEAVGVLTEGAIFDAASSPDYMLNYWTWSPGINKITGTTLVLEHKLTIGSI